MRITSKQGTEDATFPQKTRETKEKKRQPKITRIDRDASK